MQSPTLYFCLRILAYGNKRNGASKKKPLATKPKKFIANWPLKRKINLKGSLSINRCTKLHAVIGCPFFSCCKSKNCIKI